MKRFLPLLLILSVIPIQAQAESNTLNYLVQSGAIDSIESFNGGESLNQAALYKMLFKSQDIEVTMGEQWYSGYADQARQHELLIENNFNPSALVSKKDALAVLIKSYGYHRNLHTDSGQTLYSDLPSWHEAYPWVKRAVELGYLNASPSEAFYPNARLSKEEWAEWLYLFHSTPAQDTSLNNEAQIFQEALETILERYHEGDHLDRDALLEAALEGMMAELGDPYSEYLSQESTQQFLQQFQENSLEGIGAQLKETESGEIEIQGFTEVSPAREAGLELGDILLQIDEQSLEGLSLQEAIPYIRGKAGTEIRIKVQRNDVTLEFQVTRSQISIPQESSQVIGNYWLVDINLFTSYTSPNLLNHFTSLEAENPEPEAIILDLRDNPGGTLNAAVAVAGTFMEQHEPIVFLESDHGSEEIANGERGGYVGIPLYIWVNHNSASSSEIVAATLQEHGATVIGEQSFGKGTAQSIAVLSNGSSIKITSSEWLSGGRNSIQGVGVSPNIVLDETALQDDTKFIEAVESHLKNS